MHPSLVGIAMLDMYSWEPVQCDNMQMESRLQDATLHTHALNLFVVRACLLIEICRWSHMHLCHLQAVQVPVRDRQQLLESLKAQGFSETLVQWMATNLVPSPQNPAEFKWAFDIKGAAAMYHSYCKTQYWDLLASPPRGVTVNVLRAGNSERWDDAMISKLNDACAASQAGYKQVMVTACCDLFHLLDCCACLANIVHMKQFSPLPSLVKRSAFAHWERTRRTFTPDTSFCFGTAYDVPLGRAFFSLPEL
jgi:hypothetical protein